MATCGNCPTGQNHTGRDGGGRRIDVLRLELRQFRWAKVIQITR